MRILDLGEAGYEGQTEAQQHHFYIEGDYDQDRGITDRDCEEITKQLRGMGLQAHCQPDETRQGVVQIDTYSGRTTVQDGLEKAGYEADYVPSPTNMAIEQAISETSKFTKADFEENEDKNYHTENGVELAKAFGTPDEIKHMEQIAKNHYTRGHILPDEIEARNVIVSKYYPSLESQEEAMSKMEGDLGPGDIELLKPMVNMKPGVLKMYAKNIIKKYPHLADNVKSMLPANEEVVDERELTKGEEDRKEDIVKGMKKNKPDFKKRYGDEAEAVMYATATKMAKNEAVTNTNRITDLQDLNIHDEEDLKAADSMSAEELKKELIDDLHHLHSQAADNFTDDDHIADEMGDYWNNMHRKADDKTLEIYSMARDLMGEDPAVVAQMTEKYLRILGDTYINKKPDADGNYDNTSDGSELAEDVEDETKIIRLKMMQQQVEDLKSNFEILTRLDQRGTGAGDLQDQITTMYKAIESLEGVLGRSMKIVPEEIEVNEFDIKKSFNNIANNVKNTMSNVVKGNPLRNKMNKSANKNGPSIAKQINWGGKYESEDLNELDMFAPKTDFVKSPDGEYYKIEYRNNSSMTGRRKDDKARFVSIVPASEKEVNALDLEAMIGKGKSDIHTGHEVQGGHPFSDRNMAVYKYGTDDYEEEIPNNAKLKLIKVMTTEAEKNKKTKLGTKIRSWQETKADMKKKIEASKTGDKK